MSRTGLAPSEQGAPPTAPTRLTRALLGPSDGARRCKLVLELDETGSLTLLSHETGAGALAAWGEDDEEVTVRLDAGATARLALALLAERLKGRRDALQALAELCEAHGLESETARWT